MQPLCDARYLQRYDLSNVMLGTYNDACSAPQVLEASARTGVRPPAPERGLGAATEDGGGQRGATAGGAWWWSAERGSPPNRPERRERRERRGRSRKVGARGRMFQGETCHCRIKPPALRFRLFVSIGCHDFVGTIHPLAGADVSSCFGR